MYSFQNKTLGGNIMAKDSNIRKRRTPWRTSQPLIIEKGGSVYPYEPMKDLMVLVISTIFAVIAFFAFGIMSTYYIEAEVRRIVGLSYLAVIVVAVIADILYIRAKTFRTLVISKNGVTYQYGWLQCKSIRIPANKIGSCRVQSTFIQRVCATMDIVIREEENKKEFIFKNITNGRKAAEEIIKLMNENRKVQVHGFMMKHH